MKKRLCTMLTVCALLLATMLLPASAQGTSAQETIVKEKNTGAFVLNEYDQYVAKRKTSDVQLLPKGIHRMKWTF